MTPRLYDDGLSDEARQYNALGQLAAGVGHHVINAFATVVSNAEILRLSRQFPRAAADPVAIAEIIIRTSVDASAVARRLIDYSRSATAIGPELIDPADLIRRIVADELARGPRTIDWRIDAPEPVPMIRGSREQMEIMLGHLITNAREALPRSGGTIELAAGRDDRGWVVLEVRDDGCGLGPQVQERAVEPFFSTKHGHLGVGLSIANGIWRRHRGTLSIRGNSGEGTCVRLCVEPADAAAVPRPGTPPAPRES